MAICFIFTKYLNENGCLSVCLDEQGQVTASLAQRSFTEIKSLQANHLTLTVIPAQQASLHRIELPWLADKKARAALPFALEDKLVQNVEHLHFAFDRHYYQNGQYLVVVMDKAFLQDLIAKLREYSLRFDLLTLDWFALQTDEIALLDDYLLANDAHFQGALSNDLANLYLEKWLGEHRLYSFSDSKHTDYSPAGTELKASQEPSSLWIAQRLQKTKPMNLCQGDLQHSSVYEKTRRWYQAAAALTLAWVLSILAVNGIKLSSINKDTTEIDKQIATIYHEFFPKAQQVISPKFRINQLLQSSQNSTDAAFWQLANTLAQQLGKESMTIEQFRFQNQTLIVSVAVKDFASLEGLASGLQKAQVSVRQTQAATRDGQVVGTLELSL